ncbi:MAG: hypothetical protein AAFW46_14545 [Pseudomonadota bacterium]
MRRIMRRMTMLTFATIASVGLSGCGGGGDLFAEFASILDDPAPVQSTQTAALTPADPETAEVDVDAEETVDAQTDPVVESAGEAEASEQDATSSASTATTDATGDPLDVATIALAAPEEDEVDAPSPLSDEEMAAAHPAPAECRTVRLYKRPRIKVSKDLPENWRAFAGHWGDGSWNGHLCQELVIDSIDAEGNATLFDMQGYYTPWKRVPTAFRRTGKFLPDGRLRVDLGRMGVATYEMRGDVIYGVYDWGISKARIALVRKGASRTASK